ncbi:MAG: flagellar hook-length control protein FliK [Alphaproteobacteria bacterium]|nr:flagellar hook-length control protein FliK [Alphaproteobacteria bacterium]
MTQTSAADALLKTPSLLSGLLAQIGNDFTQGGIFSDLLTQSANAQASFAALAQNNPQTASSGASILASVAPAAAGTSTADTLQQLGSLSDTLNKVLALLRQRRDAAASGNNNSGQSAQSSGDAAATQDSAPATDNTPVTIASVLAAHTKTLTSQNAATTKPATPTDTVQAATDPTAAAASDTTDTQTLADILAELLTLTQLMMHSLQQSQITSGGTATAPASTTAATTDASDQTQADPLTQLMNILQQVAQQVAPQSGDGTDVADTATPTPVLTDVSQAQTSADLAAQLAALDADLKNVADAFQAAVSGGDTAGQQTALAAVAASAAVTAKTASLSVLDVMPASVQQADPLPQAVASAKQTNTLATTTSTDKPAAAPANAAFTPSTGGTNNGAHTNADAEADLAGQGGTSADASSQNTTSLNAGGTQATGTYNFASQLSAFRSVNGGATGLPSAVDQVILQLNRGVKNGDQQISLQLRPGDLGKITVKLDISSDGKVQGTVVADNAKTLVMLQKDSRSLERALQDAGLRADPGSLQFSLGGQNGNNAGQTAAQQNNNKDDAQAAGDGTASDDDLAELDTATLSETYYITPNGVNIQV